MCSGEAGTAILPFCGWRAHPRAQAGARAHGPVRSDACAVPRRSTLRRHLPRQRDQAVSRARSAVQERRAGGGQGRAQHARDLQRRAAAGGAHGPWERVPQRVARQLAHGQGRRARDVGALHPGAERRGGAPQPHAAGPRAHHAHRLWAGQGAVGRGHLHRQLHPQPVAGERRQGHAVGGILREQAGRVLPAGLRRHCLRACAEGPALQARPSGHQGRAGRLRSALQGVAPARPRQPQGLRQQTRHLRRAAARHDGSGKR